jgi:hypothetical protein
MRNSSYMVAVVLFLAAGFLFTQCSSDRYAISSRNTAPDRDEYDIEATLTYLTVEALLDRFGKNDNPYLAIETLVSGSDIIALEVTVQNNTPGNRNIIVPLERIRMVSGDSAYVPQSAYQLTAFWNNNLKKSGSTNWKYNNKSTPRKMRYVINETMFANPALVKSGESYSGIVTFMGRFTKFGYGEINVPVFDEGERVIGIFAEEFERY